MARRRKKPIPQELFQVEIESFSHDGRGIARRDGKTVFVDNALEGESVEAQYSYCSAKYDEARAVTIIEPSPHRVEPKCEFFSICGGCSLQHLNNEVQIQNKQNTLLEQLAHFGSSQPQTVQAPIVKQTTAYRRKARLGVKFVAKKDKVLVGFRERRGNFLADIDFCHVLHPTIANLIAPLKEFIYGLSARDQIPQLEVAVSGEDRLAIIVRHLSALTESDAQAWLTLAEEQDFDLYFQPKGPDTVHKVWPKNGIDRLYYEHPDFGVRLAFHPTDFTQVNQEINEVMVSLALQLLVLDPEERVLDLFCGLGNFTIPLAKRVKAVVGVEGSQNMVERGYENARLNQVDNVDFYCADLSKDFSEQSWASLGFDKVLIDPPRSGALEVLAHVAKLAVTRIVYVSCNPATLARDAGELKSLGYQLVSVGVMDMFPHTNHVESIALFEKVR